MPYLTEEHRENLRRVIEDAGSHATADTPLAWLSMPSSSPGATMKITLLGAAGGEVTGSAYLRSDQRDQRDGGLRPLPGHAEAGELQPAADVEPLKHLQAVVLTHAHLDHTGRLPLLTRFNYVGPIFATPATGELAELILRDSAYLQGEDTRRQNRFRAQAGKPLIEPLYTQREVDRLRPLFRRLRYDHPTPVADGVSVRAVEAGHILGSASLEMTVEEGGRKKVVVFSGDLGPRGAPLHRDAVPFKHADLVFLESTYGDRDHASLAETAAAAREAVKATVEQGGRILVPVFAIGRSQLLLYLLSGAFKRKTLKPFPVFLDSPMAIRATEMYRSHPELFDEEALAMRRSGELSGNLRTLKVCQKAADSMALSRKPGSMDGACRRGNVYRRPHHAPPPESSARSQHSPDHGRLSVSRVGGTRPRGRRQGGRHRRTASGRPSETRICSAASAATRDARTC